MTLQENSEIHLSQGHIASVENCNESRCSGVGAATPSKTNAYPVMQDNGSVHVNFKYKKYRKKYSWKLETGCLWELLGLFREIYSVTIKK